MSLNLTLVTHRDDPDQTLLTATDQDNDLWVYVFDGTNDRVIAPSGHIYDLPAMTLPEGVEAFVVWAMDQMQ